MKLLESDAGTPIVEACRHPNDQHLQDAAKKLLEKAIRIVPPDVLVLMRGIDGHPECFTDHGR